MLRGYTIGYRVFILHDIIRCMLYIMYIQTTFIDNSLHTEVKEGWMFLDE
jgi:hypothetical protein